MKIEVALRRKSVLQELNRLADAGVLTPRRVVQEARKATSPLHDVFNFKDVTKAAISWWEQQARVLINQFTVVIQDVSVAGEPVEASVFVHDPDLNSDRQGYVSVQKAPKAKGRRILEQEFDNLAGRIRATYGLAVRLKLTKEFTTKLDRLRKDL